MASFSCKLCGGQVELSEKMTSEICPCCGVPTTFPVVGDERMEKLFARAEGFRRTKDFDKAVAVYESILDFNGEDPDVYWGLLLSRSGIVYEEDPATHERVPVCCRKASVPILADPDYLNAQKYADGKAREIYAKEALRIAVIQDAGSRGGAESSSAPASGEPEPRQQSPSDRAESLIQKLKERYGIRDLVQAPVPLGEDPSFQSALKLVSPELRDELLESQRSQSDYALRQCLEANRAADEAALPQCAAPLADDPNFELALQCAEPDRREQLLQIRYAQSDRFLHECMKKYHVSEAFGLRRCIVDLSTDPDFSAALKCASPEQAEVLRTILSHQRKRKARRCVTLLILLLCIVSVIGSVVAVYMIYPEVGAMLGISEKQYELAEKHFTGENGNRIDYAMAAKWYRKAADRRHAAAQFCLGALYLDGNGVDKSAAEAEKWFRKAAAGLRRSAQKGNPREQTFLGMCYLNGWGIEKNEKKGVDWLRKAAEGGYAPAQFDLGCCYMSGLGVEKDGKTAMDWFRKAERKDSAAQIALGDCCMEGRGGGKDERRGVMYYRMAAKRGNAVAKFKLGNCCMEGRGVEKDKEEAVEWYLQAAEQGLLDAQLALASCYELGSGVEKNPAETVNWLRMAAMGGSAEAQCSLGSCYETGFGVEKDLEEAVKWYRQAASHDSVSAKEALERLGVSLTDEAGASEEKFP
ncbi:MAG: SEL1-like repeat protein [Lachnospiraceae bacterium]|nr:SEL1-like repeat protein [Lachnospiraceae bacterium]